MKIKSGYVIKKVMGSYMIVPLAGETNQMQTTNETGAFLWGILEKGATEDDLVSALTAEYEIEENVARADIDTFVKKLKDASLLDE